LKLQEAEAGWKKKILQVDLIGTKEVFLCLISWKAFYHRWSLWLSVLLFPGSLPLPLCLNTTDSLVLSASDFDPPLTKATPPKL
jgi:hypothetical protein